MLASRFERHALTAMVALATAAFLPAAVQAAPITVTSLGDDLNSNGNCTLREAIKAANTDAPVDACATGGGADVITIPAGTVETVLAGAGEDANATGDLDVTSDLTVEGAGRGATTLDGAELDRVLDITTGTTVTVRALTITGGRTPNAAAGAASGDGGGIRNAGTLTLQNVAITQNSTGNGGNGSPGGASGSGGGIASSGPLEVRDSLITQNASGQAGAGGPGSGSDGVAIGEAGGNGTGGAGGAAGGGAGIYGTAAVTVERSSISANSGGAGGAGGAGTGGHGGGLAGSVGGSGGAGGAGQGGAGGQGGGCAGLMGTSNVTLSDSAVVANIAGPGGAGGPGTGGNGGYSSFGGAGGNATGGAGGDSVAGGGLCISGTATVEDALVAANQASPAGAGGAASGGHGASGNGSAGGAGGHAVGGEGGHGGDGGGLVATAGTFTNVTVTDNRSAAGGAGGAAQGGAGGGDPHHPAHPQEGVPGAGTGGDGGDGGSGGAMVIVNPALTHVTIAENLVGAAGSGGSAAGGPGGGPGAPPMAFPGDAGTTGPTGGIAQTGLASATLANSIIASNQGGNCSGTITDGGRNIRQPDTTCPGTTADPLLAALADNGGPTKTMALGATSPAKSLVPATGAGCAATDQRGVGRAKGAGCEAGAYEVAPPDVTSGAATVNGQTAADIAGSVTPNGRATTYHYEYGPDTSYGTATPDTSAGSALGAGAATAALTGLQPGTTYHFRLVATNADGVSLGDDQTFTTAAPPDADGDGIVDATDNCANDANANQANNDGDAQGDVCDADDDNDGVADASDACPTVAAATVTGCAPDDTPPDDTPPDDTPPDDTPPDGTPPADTAAPDTAITGGPKGTVKTSSKRAKASFRFRATGASGLVAAIGPPAWLSGTGPYTFECRLDNGDWRRCASPHVVKVKPGKHTFRVRASDAAGNRDSSPAQRKWKVKRRVKRERA